VGWSLEKTTGGHPLTRRAQEEGPTYYGEATSRGYGNLNNRHGKSAPKKTTDEPFTRSIHTVASMWETVGSEPICACWVGSHEHDLRLRGRGAPLPGRIHRAAPR